MASLNDKFRAGYVNYFRDADGNEQRTGNDYLDADGKKLDFKGLEMVQRGALHNYSDADGNEWTVSDKDLNEFLQNSVREGVKVRPMVELTRGNQGLDTRVSAFDEERIENMRAQGWTNKEDRQKTFGEIVFDPNTWKDYYGDKENLKELPENILRGFGGVALEGLNKGVNTVLGLGLSGAAAMADAIPGVNETAAAPTIRKLKRLFQDASCQASDLITDKVLGERFFVDEVTRGWTKTGLELSGEMGSIAALGGITQARGGLLAKTGLSQTAAQTAALSGLFGIQGYEDVLGQAEEKGIDPKTSTRVKTAAVFNGLTQAFTAALYGKLTGIIGKDTAGRAIRETYGRMMGRAILDSVEGGVLGAVNTAAEAEAQAIMGEETDWEAVAKRMATSFWVGSATVAMTKIPDALGLRLKQARQNYANAVRRQGIQALVTDLQGMPLVQNAANLPDVRAVTVNGEVIFKDGTVFRPKASGELVRPGSRAPIAALGGGEIIVADGTILNLQGEVIGKAANRFQYVSAAKGAPMTAAEYLYRTVDPEAASKWRIIDPKTGESVDASVGNLEFAPESVKRWRAWAQAGRQGVAPELDAEGIAWTSLFHEAVSMQDADMNRAAQIALEKVKAGELKATEAAELVDAAYQATGGKVRSIWNTFGPGKAHNSADGEAMKTTSMADHLDGAVRPVEDPTGEASSEAAKDVAAMVTDGTMKAQPVDATKLHDSRGENGEGPLVVREDANGECSVVSGEVPKGAKTVNAVVLKEQDGWTPENADKVAAELGLKEGTLGPAAEVKAKRLTGTPDETGGKLTEGNLARLNDENLSAMSTLAEVVNVATIGKGWAALQDELGMTMPEGSDARTIGLAAELKANNPELSVQEAWELAGWAKRNNFAGRGVEEIRQAMAADATAQVPVEQPNGEIKSVGDMEARAGVDKPVDNLTTVSADVEERPETEDHTFDMSPVEGMDGVFSPARFPEVTVRWVEDGGEKVPYVEGLTVPMLLDTNNRQDFGRWFAELGDMAVSDPVIAEIAEELKKNHLDERREEAFRKTTEWAIERLEQSELATAVLDEGEFEATLQKYPEGRQMAADGKTWGFSIGSKVYLNKALLGTELGLKTAIHEFTHPALVALKKVNPEMFGRMMELAPQLPGFQELKASEEYGRLAENEIAMEAWCRLMEGWGSEKFRSQVPAKIYEEVNELVKRFAAQFGENVLGIRNFTPAMMAGWTMKDYLDAVGGEIMSGRKFGADTALTAADAAKGFLASVEGGGELDRLGVIGAPPVKVKPVKPVKPGGAKDACEVLKKIVGTKDDRRDLHYVHVEAGTMVATNSKSLLAAPAPKGLKDGDYLNGVPENGVSFPNWRAAIPNTKNFQRMVVANGGTELGAINFADRLGVKGKLNTKDGPGVSVEIGGRRYSARYLKDMLEAMYKLGAEKVELYTEKEIEKFARPMVLKAKSERGELIGALMPLRNGNEHDTRIDLKASQPRFSIGDREWVSQNAEARLAQGWTFRPEGLTDDELRALAAVIPERHHTSEQTGFRAGRTDAILEAMYPPDYASTYWPRFVKQFNGNKDALSRIRKALYLIYGGDTNNKARWTQLDVPRYSNLPEADKAKEDARNKELHDREQAVYKARQARNKELGYPAYKDDPEWQRLDAEYNRIRQERLSPSAEQTARFNAMAEQRAAHEATRDERFEQYRAERIAQGEAELARVAKEYGVEYKTEDGQIRFARALPGGKVVEDGEVVNYRGPDGVLHGTRYSKFLRKPISKTLDKVLDRLAAGEILPEGEIEKTEEWAKAIERKDRVEANLLRKFGVENTSEIKTPGRTRIRAAILEAGLSPVVTRTTKIAGLNRPMEMNEALKDGESYTVAQERKVFIVTGLPASGKSSSLANPISLEMKARICDSDAIKKVLPEFDEGYGGNAVHEESTNINEDILSIAAGRGDNIVYPILGYKSEKLRKALDFFKKKEYTTYLLFNELPQSKAMSRLITRFLENGRYLPLSCVTKAGDKAIEAFKEVKDYADHYAHISNDVQFGEEPKGNAADEGIQKEVSYIGEIFRQRGHFGQRRDLKSPVARRSGLRGVSEGAESSLLRHVDDVRFSRPVRVIKSPEGMGEREPGILAASRELSAREELGSAAARRARKLSLSMSELEWLRKKLTGDLGDQVVGRKSSARAKGLALNADVFGLVDRTDMEQLKRELKAGGYFRNEEAAFCRGASKEEVRAERERSEAALADRLNALAESRTKGDAIGGQATARGIFADMLGKVITRLPLDGMPVNLKSLRSLGDALKAATKDQAFKLEAMGAMPERGALEKEPSDAEVCARMVASYLISPDSLEHAAPKWFGAIEEVLLRNAKLRGAMEELLEGAGEGRGAGAIALDKIRREQRGEVERIQNEINAAINEPIKRPGVMKQLQEKVLVAFHDKMAPVVLRVNDQAKLYLKAAKEAMKAAKTPAEVRAAQAEIDRFTKGLLSGMKRLMLARGAWERGAWNDDSRYLYKMLELENNATERWGLVDGDISNFMFLQRTVELGGRAVSHGLTVRDAQKELDRIKAEDPEKYARLDEYSQKFHAIVEQEVIDNPAMRRMFGDQFMDFLKTQTHYVTMRRTLNAEQLEWYRERLKQAGVQVTDDIYDKIERWAGRGGRGADGGDFTAQLKGSMSAKAEVRGATMEKHLRAFRSVRKNDYVLAMKDLLVENGVEGVKVLPRGSYKSNGRYGFVNFMENGERFTLQVPKEIAQGFEHDALDGAGAIRKFHGLVRSLYIDWNFGYWLNNINRNTSSIEKNMPGMREPWIKTGLRATVPGAAPLFELATNALARRLSEGSAAHKALTLLVGKHAPVAFIPEAKRIAEYIMEPSAWQEKLWQAEQAGDQEAVRQMLHDRDTAWEMLKGNMLVTGAAGHGDVDVAKIDELFGKRGLKTIQERRRLEEKHEKLGKIILKYAAKPFKANQRQQEYEDVLAKTIAYLHDRMMFGDVRTVEESGAMVGDKVSIKRGERKGSLNGVVQLTVNQFFNQVEKGTVAFYKNFTEGPGKARAAAAGKSAQVWLSSLMGSLVRMGLLAKYMLSQSDNDEEKAKEKYGKLWDYAKHMERGWSNTSNYLRHNYNLVPILNVGEYTTVSIGLARSDEDKIIGAWSDLVAEFVNSRSGGPDVDLLSTAGNLAMQGMVPDFQSSTPVMSLLQDTLEVLRHNPYDGFRGAEKFDRDTYRLRGESGEMFGNFVLAAGMNLWNDLGGRAFIEPEVGGRAVPEPGIGASEEEAGAVAGVRALHTALKRLPVVGPAMKRMVKISVGRPKGHAAGLVDEDGDKLALVRVLTKDALKECRKRGELWVEADPDGYYRWLEDKARQYKLERWYVDKLDADIWNNWNDGAESRLEQEKREVENIKQRLERW